MRILFARLGSLATMALCILLFAMVALVCLNVALRYVWGASLLWADEVLVFAMVGLVFLGCIGVSTRDEHLRMGLFAQLLPQRTRALLAGLEQLAIIAICLFVAWQAWKMTATLFRRGAVSNMAEVPLWLMQAILLLGLAGMVVVALSRLVRLLLPKRNA